MKAVVSDNSIDLEGVRYFVGKASRITFGSWGDKKTPNGPGALDYLEACDVLPALGLARVKLGTTPLAVDFRDAAAINLMAALSVPGLASGKVGLKKTDFSDGKVRLVKISPRGAQELVDQINTAPKVIDRLVELGASARVVVDVLIAVEAALYGRFAAGAAHDGAVLVDGLMVRADREPGWDRSSEVRVGPGTVLGYRLAEPQWDRSPGTNTTRVASLCDDQPVCRPPTRSPR